MEENKLSHNVPTWKNTRNPTSQVPPNSSSSLSLEPNKLKHMNKDTQACKSPNNKDSVNDDMEEEQDDDEKGESTMVEETGREKLKRHREEVMGRVKIPEDWGQEKLMKDWIDYTTFDALFAPHRMIVAARDALIADGRKAARSQRLRIHSSC